MIVITTIDGVLRIQAEIPVPSAPGGQWDPARIGRLQKLICERVNAAELIDESALAIEIADRSPVELRRQAVRTAKPGLELVSSKQDAGGLTVGIGQREGK